MAPTRAKERARILEWRSLSPSEVPSDNPEHAVGPRLPDLPRNPDALNAGRHDTLDGLMPEVYEELRLVARHHLAGREGGGTLSTTGLVHEAYLKLADRPGRTWRDRGHFFAMASVAMRHILVDRARARMAQKREGALHRVTLDAELIAIPDQPEAMLQLHDAIERLAAVEPRLARVVDCRFFGGMTDEEIAGALEVTPRTVQRDWLKARMLLRRALEP